MAAGQFATPLPRPRSAQFVVYGHFRSDYARYRDSVDKHFTKETLDRVCGEDACGPSASWPRVIAGTWHFAAPPTDPNAPKPLTREGLLALLDVAELPKSPELLPVEFCGQPEQQLRLKALADLTADESAQAEALAGVCEKALSVGPQRNGLEPHGSGWKPVKDTKDMLPLRFPGRHRRADIVRYLNGEDRQTLGLFTQFATGVSDREAYAVTDILSGLMGRALFAASFTAVVATDTSDNDIKRRFVEGTKANVLRMVNNGGTLTGRVLLPIHATAGPTFQSASSFYVTAGAIGSTGNPDSMTFAGTVNLEVMTGHAIRDLLETATELGELQIGGRIGLGYTGRELVKSTGDHWLPYAQVGIGLRKGGTLALSALLTWTLDSEYDDYRPRRLLLNFSASP